MDDLGGLPVIDEVGDYEVIDGIGLENGIEVVTLVGPSEFRDEFGLGVGLPVHLRDGQFGRPLVLLHIQDLFGNVSGVLVQFHALVGNHTLGVNIAYGRHYRRLQGGVFPQ